MRAARMAAVGTAPHLLVEDPKAQALRRRDLGGVRGQPQLELVRRARIVMLSPNGGQYRAFPGEAMNGAR